MTKRTDNTDLVPQVASAAAQEPAQGPLAQVPTTPSIVTNDEVNSLHYLLVTSMQMDLSRQLAAGEVDPALRRDVINYCKNIGVTVASTTSMKDINTEAALEEFNNFLDNR